MNGQQPKSSSPHDKMIVRFFSHLRLVPTQPSSQIASARNSQILFTARKHLNISEGDSDRVENNLSRQTDSLATAIESIAREADWNTVRATSGLFAPGVSAAQNGLN